MAGHASHGRQNFGGDFRDASKLRRPARILGDDGKHRRTAFGKQSGGIHGVRSTRTRDESRQEQQIQNRGYGVTWAVRFGAISHGDHIFARFAALWHESC
jgi:hypothetical protein